VSWVWRIAVQLLDMVSNSGAYVVGQSEVVERRSPWIKVFCDRDLSDELTVPDMQEEKRRRCRGTSGQLWKVSNGNRSNYTTSLTVWELMGIHELVIDSGRAVGEGSKVMAHMVFLRPAKARPAPLTSI
jgi:hypothetical protein